MCLYHPTDPFAQANTDVYNFVSMGPVWLTAVHGAEQGPFIAKARPQLVFNIDTASVLLEHATTEVFVNKVLDTYLREHNAAATHTRTEEKHRGLSMLPLIAADGALLCTVVILKDAKYTAPHLIKVHTDPPLFTLHFTY